SFEEGNTEFGGYLKAMVFQNGVAETMLRGPENPILKQEETALRKKRKDGTWADGEKGRLEELGKSKDVVEPMKVRWTEGSGQAEIEIQGTKLTLKTGGWAAGGPPPFKFRVPA